MTNITISINGQQQQVAQGSSIQQAIDHLEQFSQLESREFVIALNHNFVPRSQYDQTQLQENDAIELLSPMAGG